MRTPQKTRAQLGLSIDPISHRANRKRNSIRNRIASGAVFIVPAVFLIAVAVYLCF